MIIQLPLTLGDKIWHQGRVQSKVNHIEFDINNEGVDISNLRIGSEHESASHIRYLHHKNNTTEFNRPLSFNIPHNVGDTIYYLNSSYNNIGLLKRGKIKEIKCLICKGFTIFNYRVDGYNSTIDEYNIFNSIEDFKNRTKSLIKLKDNEKFIFTQYLMQQNNLKVVKVSKHSETHYKTDRGEIIRGSQLYNSSEKFFNKMLAQVD